MRMQQQATLPANGHHYWVIGGEYADTSFRRLAGGSAAHLNFSQRATSSGSTSPLFSWKTTPRG